MGLNERKLFPFFSWKCSASNSYYKMMHQTANNYMMKQQQTTDVPSNEDIHQRVYLRTCVLNYWHHVPYLWRLLSIINYSKIQFAMTNCHTYHSIKFRKINFKILTKSRYELTGTLFNKKVLTANLIHFSSTQ